MTTSMDLANIENKDRKMELVLDAISDDSGSIQMAGQESESDRNVQKIELKEFLENNKPYLNPELTLSLLSEETGIKKHDLSAAINSGFEMNFFDLINHYRTKEFVNQYQLYLSQDKQSSFIEVAYQVGFNSKTVFNRAFKKETGTTPSQYFKLKQVA